MLLFIFKCYFNFRQANSFDACQLLRLRNNKQSMECFKKPFSVFSFIASIMLIIVCFDNPPSERTYADFAKFRALCFLHYILRIIGNEAILKKIILYLDYWIFLENRRRSQKERRLCLFYDTRKTILRFLYLKLYRLLTSTR